MRDRDTHHEVFPRLAHFCVALALALGASVQPITAAPVAAIDCTAVYCATLEMVPSPGAGVGRVTSDPAGLDCTWNGAARGGACVYQFTWPHFQGSGTEVDLIIDPDFRGLRCCAASSAARWPRPCAATP